MYGFRFFLTVICIGYGSQGVTQSVETQVSHINRKITENILFWNNVAKKTKEIKECLNYVIHNLPKAYVPNCDLVSLLDIVRECADAEIVSASKSLAEGATVQIYCPATATSDKISCRNSRWIEHSSLIVKNSTGSTTGKPSPVPTRSSASSSTTLTHSVNSTLAIVNTSSSQTKDLTGKVTETFSSQEANGSRASESTTQDDSKGSTTITLETGAKPSSEISTTGFTASPSNNRSSNSTGKAFVTFSSRGLNASNMTTRAARNSSMTTPTPETSSKPSEADRASVATNGPLKVQRMNGTVTSLPVAPPEKAPSKPVPERVQRAPKNPAANATSAKNTNHTVVSEDTEEEDCEACLNVPGILPSNEQKGSTPAELDIEL